MFKPNELESIPLPFESLMADLEMRIMQDIVRRIKINGEITRAADWQIYRLEQLGESKRVIKKYIKEALGLNNAEINHLYKDVVRQGYSRDQSLYKAKGKALIPFSDNKALQQLISATALQTEEDLKNITKSLGFAKKVNGKIEFTPIADYYQRTLDNAMMDISSGAFSYNEILKRTVSELTSSGLRTVDYATGWSNRVPVATRRAVMTGFNQVVSKISDNNAKELDTEYFEVSWHGTARPSHQEWQGKVYNRRELTEICGLGSADGLCGCNCRHSYDPFIPGVSERTYTDEELAEMNAKENTATEYRGKEYTAYEASQYQRKMETLMRKQRQDIKLFQEGGADEDEIIYARCRYRSTSAQYVEFSKVMGLPQQRGRVAVDGLGGVGIGKIKDSFATLTKVTTASGIKVTEVSKHLKDRVKERGIEIESIKSALTNPLKKSNIREDKTQQFIGEKATVAINVDTGKITTVWSTSSKKAKKLKGGI